MSEMRPFILWKRCVLYPPFGPCRMNCFLWGSCFFPGVFIPSFLTWYFTPGGHSLIKVTGCPTIRLLPRSVQQLKLLHRVDTRSQFLQPREKMKTLLPRIDTNVEMRSRADKKFGKWDFERTNTSFSLTGAPGVFY